MLTIHVGLQKTGSTAIQRGLAGMTREELGGRGVHYRGKESAANNDGFLLLPRRIFQVPPRADRTPTVKRIRAGHHVVLSDEAFLGRPDAPDLDKMYSHAVSSAAAMRDYFHDKAPFQIVIYLRPQYQWLESLHNQRAKRGYLAIDSTKFAEQGIQAPYFQWTKLVSDLKEELGPDRLVVRPYQPGMNVTSDFLTILGIPTPQRLLDQKPENPSLSPQEIALRQQLLNSLQEAGEPGLLSWAMSIDHGLMSRKSTVDFSMFTEAIQARLIEITARDWEHLPTVVADTHLAEPHLFESLAQDAQQTQVKPYFGTLDEVSIDKEALRLLIAALPYVRTYQRRPLVRVKSLAARIRVKVRTDPRGLPRAGASFLRRKTREVTRH